jgi:hypothetical protein
MKQSKDTLFLSSVLKLRFVTISFISVSQTSRCLMSKAHNVTWYWVPGCFETLRRGEMRRFCANTTGCYGFLKLLKIFHIIYNDIYTRLSLSLSHTHTHRHTHTHTMIIICWKSIILSCTLHVALQPFWVQVIFVISNSLVQVTFPQNLLSSKYKKQPLYCRNLGKTS